MIYDIISNSKTVIWSGPLGYFEKKPYDRGTNKLANLINSKKTLISIAGGGDTIAAIKKNKKIQNFSYLSTGGGAFLHWLEKYLVVVHPIYLQYIKINGLKNMILLIIMIYLY